MKTRLDQRSLLALIDSAYAAVEDARLWEPLLASLADAVGGTSACLLSHDLVANGTAVVMSGLHPDVLPLYNEHYHKVDAWALAPQTPWRAKELPTLGDEAVLRRSQLQKTEFYPYLLKYGISRMMHTTLRVDTRGVAGLSLYRRERDAAFGEREAAFVKALAPHLRRALRLYDVVAGAAQERETALQGLDTVPIGILLVAGEGRVVHANRAAESILARRDGLFLDRSLLTTGVPATTANLRTDCAECAKTTRGDGLRIGRALSLPRPSGRRNLQVLVSPVHRTRPFGVQRDGIGAIVFVADPEQTTLPSARLIQMLYGLTAAESRVAALLALGRSPAEISETCNYTMQTVQWYSKQILSKTGCRNRAALVRELSGALPSLVTSTLLSAPESTRLRD